MERKLISSGSIYEERYGHSRAVAVGNMVFVAGTVGFNYAERTVSDDPAEQTRQTFRNIENALKEAGSSLSDVVSIVTYFTNHDDWDAIGEVLREELQHIRPGNAGVRVELIDPKMKVEISAIAVKSD